jgi:hypothetical protein
LAGRNGRPAGRSYRKNRPLITEENVEAGRAGERNHDPQLVAVGLLDDHVGIRGAGSHNVALGGYQRPGRLGGLLDVGLVVDRSLVNADDRVVAERDVLLGGVAGRSGGAAAGIGLAAGGRPVALGRHGGGEEKRHEEADKSNDVFHS